ncbi:Bug family tripartite tricarboxylate transporter substrate binding protein [Aquabacterium sp.]|uniref:Bug family tripartite tricarboxylate transporter substrate binding protein n=1 Tax=Aquabacterium sp. TaxID=1872578 RepID=UPI002C4239C5|nr:tripartite tricarboxylate transporter substrate binding protein [Aquabacterium sp.]HSW04809.1 tripartite tricarboxylate transporter substrate binding protein [Aquabacterium sp.]
MTTSRPSPLRLITLYLLGIGLMLAGPALRAQPAWPARSISFIVPYSAGGSLDATARLVAQRLAERLGQQVVIENVTGAGGGLGFAKAMQAPADGYTFLIAGDSPLNPNAPAGGPYYKHDVLKELVPVVLVNTAPMVLVAHPALPANTLGELIALARKQPGRLSYATSGIGTLPHLATEMIKQQARVHMVHIPYRGGSQIANDVAGNQVDLAMLIAASAAPFVQAKTLKPIAVTGERRLALLPEVPAAAETAGFKDFKVVSWAGLYAPAKTPAAVVARLAQEVDEVLKTEAVRDKLAQQGALAGGGTPAAFISFIEQDRARIGRVLQVTSLRE